MPIDEWDEETKADVEAARWVKVASQEESCAYLIVLAGANVGQVYKLGEGSLTLGRSVDADIPLTDEGLSRLHARLAYGLQGVTLEDLQSRNGTFVNGARIDAVQRLNDGDRIIIGRTTILKFTYQDGLEESYSRKMYEAALKDPLTGLFNKKHFFDRLTSEFSYSARHGLFLSLLFLDLDHFKKVNDTHGHLVGDEVLKNFAEKVMATVRTEDLVARYGGEEFVVLARGIDDAQATQFAERLRELIARRPFEVRSLSVPVTVSIGVAVLADGRFEAPEELVTAADAALYEAKRGGRNRVCLAAPPAG